MTSQIEKKSQSIAVVGMALRVPGANTLEQFWQNILDGRDCLTRSSIDELYQAGVPRRNLANPQSVRAMPKLDDIEYFDASFFNMAASEADRTDPVHRLFLECAWEALEHAGIVPGHNGPVTGVFGGEEGYYLRSNLEDLLEDDPAIQLSLSIGNDIDFFTTRVSNKLNLNGPSFAVMAACATSLLAIHLAVKSIQQGECEVAVAGGGTLILPQLGGYLAGVDGMLSATGRVRTFDAAADGTVFGNGVGVVVLRSLDSALEEGNQVYAVIKGSATSNDGNPPGKQSFIAPSPEGQVLAIANALVNADTGADTIGLVEAHGTGTLLGDPVEVKSLTQVYRHYTDKNEYCALGSVKANVGHLRTAAGVVSLIKTCLAIKHGILPPTANFDTPNPKINFKESPFYILREPSEWLQPPHLRRAGISAFGFGGSNAHIVLEGFEQPAADQSSRDNHLFVISAKGDKALTRRLTDLYAYIEDNPDQSPADIAYTLQSGRQAMSHRICFHVNDASFSAASVLQSESHISGIATTDPRPLVFLFPGQGSQWPGMGQGLYASEPVYRETVDYCAKFLQQELGFDLRTLIHTDDNNVDQESIAALKQTANAQPALFVVEYATANLFQSWGVIPDAMLGHSVGELVAACIAGVFSLDDALKIVAARSRLMQNCKPGLMAAVLMSAEELSSILPDKVEIATINAPNLTVVSGPTGLIEQFTSDLADKGISSQNLKTSHAFHSWMMEPALDEFRKMMNSIELQPPRIQILSNVTGEPLTENQATDTNYWAEHIRRAVHFSKGLEFLLTKEAPVFIELGPGRTLTDLVRRQSEGNVFASMLSNPSAGNLNEQKDALEALGKLWCAGVDVRWQNFYGSENRRKVNLPTYPFQRYRHWIIPDEDESLQEYPLSVYEPGWVDVPLEIDESPGQGNLWLVFNDKLGLAQAVIRQLGERGEITFSLVPGDDFARINDQQFRIRAGHKDDLAAVLTEMGDTLGEQTLRVLHFWSFTGKEQENNTVEAFKTASLYGFHTLLALVQAAYDFGINHKLKVLIVANGLAQLDNETNLLHAEKGLLLGPCRVIPQEINGLAMRCIDMPSNYLDITDPVLPPTIIAEAMAENKEVLTALRLNGRYAEKMFNLPALSKGKARLRQGGTVFITGGVGGLGLLTAKHLFDTVRARLVLCSRWLPPPRDQWVARANKNDKVGRALKELIELEASGAEVLVVKTDVTDFDSLSAAVSQARSHFGGINGVVHAAGIIDDGPVLGKTREDADRVFGAKVIGALNLEKIFADSILDLFIYFSSMSSYYPNVGQADYSAANAVLDRLARRRAKDRPGLCCAMGWAAWTNIGMGISYGEFKPVSQSLFDQLSDISPAGPEEEVGHVLLSTRKLYPGNRNIYRGMLQLNEHWVTRDHLINGESLISATTIIEMVRASFADHIDGNGFVELQNISFFNPWFVGAQGSEFEILLEPMDDGERFELRSRICKSSKEWTVNAMGYCCLTQDGPVVPEFLVPEFPLSYVTDYDSIIERGPHFICEEGFQQEGESFYARVRLADEFHNELDEYGLHPSLFDRAVHVIMEELFEFSFVPYTFGAICQYGKLPAELMVYVQKSPSGDSQAYDIRIGNPRGKTLVEVTGYVMRNFQKTHPALSDNVETGILSVSLQDAPNPQRIVFDQPGNLESLHLQEFTPTLPQKDEVQVKVMAAGLNFRDVLAVLGQLAEKAETKTMIGGECSGIIKAVGKNVDHLRVGDRVVAMSNNSFATHVTVPAHSVTYLPGNISFTDGAGIPITFLTVDYALNKLARLQENERILIHAATGGVGLAAVQLAQKAGAEIFATAGHDDKRQYLHEIGVKHVMDSRSLDFVDAVLEKTNGEGVDVVLNSLAGEFIPASLKLLKPFGRFLEVGKRDIYENMQLGLYPFHNNLSYFAIDLGQVKDENPLEFEELFENLMLRFACGKLTPSPTAVMPINEISKGFNRMAKAEHIGKIVISIGDEDDDDPLEKHRGSSKKMAHQGVEREKGLEVFNRLISSDETPPYVMIMKTSQEGSEKKKNPLSVIGESQLQRKVDTPFCEPTCTEEAILVEIWQRTLGITPIGINDNFFELGGDSINAILIQFEISKKFKVKLPTTVLFDYSTVKDLAALLP